MNAQRIKKLKTLIGELYLPYQVLPLRVDLGIMGKKKKKEYSTYPRTKTSPSNGFVPYPGHIEVDGLTPLHRCS